MKFFLLGTWIILGWFVSLYPLQAQDNIAPHALQRSTSYVSTWEKLEAINDGYEPQNSGDKGPGAYGNWRGDAYFNQWNWVAYEFDSYYRIDSTDVYWWADGLGIHIPYDSYLQYWDIFEGDWKTIEEATGNGVLPDQYNQTTFPPVLTNKIRLFCISTAAQGILEWKVYGERQENVPEKSILRISQPLTKNETTTFALQAKSGSLPVPGYTFVVKAKVWANLVATREVYTVAGQEFSQDAITLEMEPTNDDGLSQFEILLPETIDPTDGIEVSVLLHNGITPLARLSYREPGLIPPALHPDATGITVDDTLVIEYTDDPAW
ncbi:MAG TPA: hypothetical protein PLK12_14040, partial [Prolixibacteraceae bacterium]|nr:hypothetical protein [Prolixibacteraceae bacterium]